jgi:hypothetical protein
MEILETEISAENEYGIMKTEKFIMSDCLKIGI